MYAQLCMYEQLILSLPESSFFIGWRHRMEDCRVVFSERLIEKKKQVQKILENKAKDKKCRGSNGVDETPCICSVLTT